MAFIRPYRPSDWEDTAHICRATLPPSLAASPAAVRLAPYIWTHQFTLLSPSTCFVLDDGAGDGHVAGYVIGCPDVHAMAAQYDRYVELVGGTGPAADAAAALGVPAAFVEQARRDVGAAPGQLDILEAWTQPDGAVNETCLRQLVYSARWLLLDSSATPRKRALVAAGSPFRATMHIDLLPGHQRAGWGRRMIAAFVQAVAAAGARGLHININGENTRVVAFYERCGFRVEPGGEAEGGVWMVRGTGGL